MRYAPSNGPSIGHRKDHRGLGGCGQPCEEVRAVVREQTMIWTRRC